METKQVIGIFLTFIILTTFSFIVFNNGDSQFKIKFYETHSEYYVFENNSHLEKILDNSEMIFYNVSNPIYSIFENYSYENESYYNYTWIIGYEDITLNKTVNNYVYEYIKDESFVLAADEYIKLLDGTKIMRAKSREQLNWSEGDYWYFQNIANYKDNISTKETFQFDIYESNIESTPLERTFECVNCEDKFIQFEIRDILYEDETQYIESGFNFGHNMKLEWETDDDFSWAKVYQQKSSDKIIVKFKADESHEKYFVRLFDPVWFSESWSYYKEYTNLTGNFTYMEINMTANDDDDWNDTRFVSCYDETLVFNHTLEAEIGTIAQFRINNQGENCTLRYYGNSGATTISNASNTYFEPIAAYYLDANANDFVGSNDGTVSGAVLDDGYINGSYDFDGSDDYMNGDEINTGNEWSVSSWIMADTLTTNYAISNGNKALTYQAWCLRVDSDGKIRIQSDTSTDSSSTYLTTSSHISTEEWYHVAMTRESGEEPKIYVDGTLVSGSSEDDWGGTMVYGSDNILIGAYENSGSPRLYWDGKIDEVLIYDKALTQDQISQLYTQTAPTITEGAEQSNTENATLPNVTINSPLNQTYNTSTIVFNVTATADDGIDSCVYSLDGNSNVTMGHEGDVAENDYGNGVDGEIIFTTTTKSYGSLTVDTDYKVSGNTLYLKVDRLFNFTNFTLGAGTVLAPYDPDSTGAVIYLNVNNSATINGTVKSNFLDAYNAVRGQYVDTSFISPNGTISTPSTRNGGSGATVHGVGGGSQSNGYGGGGAGGSAVSVDGGDGGDGGTTPSGGVGGSLSSAGSDEGTAGLQSRGGGGAAYVIYSGDADGGDGGTTFGSDGGDSSGSNYAGGGGGTGGQPGYSGINFYLSSKNIEYYGIINTSGTAGQDGGEGGACSVCNGFDYPGGGAGGGGGGNAGDIVFFYNNIVNDGTNYITGGSGGSSGTVAPYYATSGSSGLSGTFSLYEGEESTVSDYYNYTNSSMAEGQHNVTFYCNDTSGNTNQTNYVYFKIDTSSDSCTYSSGDWEVECSDNCVIDSNVNLGGNDLLLIGSGSFILDADISNYGLLDFRDSTDICEMIFNDGAHLIS